MIFRARATAARGRHLQGGVMGFGAFEGPVASLSASDLPLRDRLNWVQTSNSGEEGRGA
jgi:hypothetical protein